MIRVLLSLLLGACRPTVAPAGTSEPVSPPLPAVAAPSPGAPLATFTCASAAADLGVPSATVQSCAALVHGLHWVVLADASLPGGSKVYKVVVEGDRRLAGAADAARWLDAVPSDLRANEVAWGLEAMGVMVGGFDGNAAEPTRDPVTADAGLHVDPWRLVLVRAGRLDGGGLTQPLWVRATLRREAPSAYTWTVEQKEGSADWALVRSLPL